MGLWTLAGSHCMDYLTDGLVESWFVDSWPDGQKLAERLVKVGMWDVSPEGWVFHDWDTYQPSAAKVKDTRAARAQAGSKGGQAKAEANRVANAKQNEKQNRAPSPSPSPSPYPETTYVSQSSPEPNPVDNSARSTLAGLELDPDRLMREIKSRTGREVSPSVALRVALEWIGRGVNVKKPMGYLITCLRDSSVEVQQFIDEQGNQ
jgi:hypothetical protein